MNFQVGEQVVVRKQVTRSGPVTKEVKVGQIAALSDSGKTATVTLPRNNGTTERKEIPTSQLQPVREAFGRSRVQMNSARRQIARW